jgi:hypothetical protein
MRTTMPISRLTPRYSTELVATPAPSTRNGAPPASATATGSDVTNALAVASVKATITSTSASQTNTVNAT